jgi:membrane protease YdiL (CAAX protease family)
MAMKALRYDPKDLLTSLVLVFPLFLIYQVGVLFTLPVLNGADFLTVFLFHNLGLSTGAYLAYTVAVAIAFGVGVALLRRKQKFNPRLVVPVLIESAIYALTMGSLIVFVMTRVLHVSPRLAGGAIATQGLGSRFVMSLGAGVWEETIFRLGIMTGVAVLLERVLGLGRWVAVAVALLASSVLFSAMHHIPPYGDPLHLGVFLFRVLAGCFFGLVYWFRGFAIAVYTHALYDIYVLLVR